MVDFTRREVVAGALDQAVWAATGAGPLFVRDGQRRGAPTVAWPLGRARVGLTWTEGADPPLPS